MTYPAVSLNARRSYAEHIRGNASAPWWDAVVLTASSERQAERYMEEIRTRQHQGTIPEALYVAVPDSGDRRIGSGGATLNALRVLGPKLEKGWTETRVLMIHSGGDSRRLPQYSLSGKLFGALPGQNPLGRHQHRVRRVSRSLFHLGAMPAFGSGGGVGRRGVDV